MTESKGAKDEIERKNKCQDSSINHLGHRDVRTYHSNVRTYVPVVIMETAGCSMEVVP